MTYRFAVGHDREGAVSRPWALGRPSAPVGGLVASVRELLTYARVQWEPDGFLSPESLNEMRRPHARNIRGSGDSCGLGWFLFDRGDYSFITHAGGTNGQHALLTIAPEARLALAVLTNHDNGPAVYKAVQSDVLRAALGVEAAPITYVDLSAEELAEYVGAYEGQLTTARVTIADGSLLLEAIPNGGFPLPDSPAPPGPPPTRLAFDATDAVVAVDPPLEGGRGEFIRWPGNDIVWCRWGGRLLRRVV